MSDGTKFWGNHAVSHNRVTHREYGELIDMLPARDIFRSDDEGYLIILNPSSRVRQVWDHDFQG